MKGRPSKPLRRSTPARKPVQSRVEAMTWDVSNGALPAVDMLAPLLQRALGGGWPVPAATTAPREEWLRSLKPGSQVLMYWGTKAQWVKDHRKIHLLVVTERDEKGWLKLGGEVHCEVRPSDGRVSGAYPNEGIIDKPQGPHYAAARRRAIAQAAWAALYAHQWEDVPPSLLEVLGALFPLAPAKTPAHPVTK